MPEATTMDREAVSDVCLESRSGHSAYSLVFCTNPFCSTHRPGGPRLLSSGERPTINTLRHLWEMRVELETKWVAGPWDSWDGRLLEKWLQDVKRAISDAETDIDARLESYGESRWER